MSAKSVGCVIMAAGNARRFGENKLAAKLNGRSLVARALDAVPAGLFAEVVVVTQYGEVERMAQSHGFTCLRNEHPDWGISHTISIGTNHLKNCDAILYMVSDQPLLRGDSIERVVECWKEHPSQIVGAAHDGRRGNPCIFPREFFGELLQLREDHGGNTVIRAHPERLRTLEVEPEQLTDVDTPKALADLKSSIGQP